MSKLVPNLSKPGHLDAIHFKATAELAGDLLLRGLEVAPVTFDLALKNSLKNKNSIMFERSESFDEKNKLLESEGKRERYFRDFGPAQNLVASTVLAYATLDTVLAEAVRLLEFHAGFLAPKQNMRGSTTEANLKHLKKVLPELSLLNSRDQTVMDDFSKIRNILIHQGYFVKEHDSRITALRASEYDVDYFEIRPGFPILLRSHGVGHFVMVCNEIIKNVAESVYNRLISK